MWIFQTFAPAQSGLTSTEQTAQLQDLLSKSLDFSFKVKDRAGNETVVPSFYGLLNDLDKQARLNDPANKGNNFLSTLHAHVQEVVFQETRPERPYPIPACAFPIPKANESFMVAFTQFSENLKAYFAPSGRPLAIERSEEGDNAVFTFRYTGTPQAVETALLAWKARQEQEAKSSAYDSNDSIRSQRLLLSFFSSKGQESIPASSLSLSLFEAWLKSRPDDPGQKMNDSDAQLVLKPLQEQLRVGDAPGRTMFFPSTIEASKFGAKQVPPKLDFLSAGYADYQRLVEQLIIHQGDLVGGMHDLTSRLKNWDLMTPEKRMVEADAIVRMLSGMPEGARYGRLLLTASRILDPDVSRDNHLLRVAYSSDKINDNLTFVQLLSLGFKKAEHAAGIQVAKSKPTKDAPELLVPVLSSSSGPVNDSFTGGSRRLFAGMFAPDLKDLSKQSPGTLKGAVEDMGLGLPVQVDLTGPMERMEKAKPAAKMENHKAITDALQDKSFRTQLINARDSKNQPYLAEEDIKEYLRNPNGYLSEDLAKENPDLWWAHHRVLWAITASKNGTLDAASLVPIRCGKSNLNFYDFLTAVVNNEPGFQILHDMVGDPSNPNAVFFYLSATATMELVRDPTISYADVSLLLNGILTKLDPQQIIYKIPSPEPDFSKPPYHVLKPWRDAGKLESRIGLFMPSNQVPDEAAPIGFVSTNDLISTMLSNEEKLQRAMARNPNMAVRDFLLDPVLGFGMSPEEVDNYFKKAPAKYVPKTVSEFLTLYDGFLRNGYKSANDGVVRTPILSTYNAQGKMVKEGIFLMEYAVIDAEGTAHPVDVTDSVTHDIDQKKVEQYRAQQFWYIPRDSKGRPEALRVQHMETWIRDRKVGHAETALELVFSPIPIILSKNRRVDVYADGKYQLNLQFDKKFEKPVRVEEGDEVALPFDATLQVSPPPVSPPAPQPK